MSSLQRTRKLMAVAGLVSLALVAAACGGDDSKNSSAPATTAAGGATRRRATADDRRAGGHDDHDDRRRPARRRSPSGRRCGPRERAAIVKRIKDNKWGKSADGKTLTGPEGWTVDLTKCPAGWSDTEGVSDTTIKIGAVDRRCRAPTPTTPTSGKAIDFLFDYYNDQGLFKDASNGKTRKVDYTMKDDGYDAARAIPNVDELLDSDKVVRHLDAGLAGHAEDLRQDQPALRAPARWR